MTSSENAKESYERLEFLGDRVLNLIVSEYLYVKFSGCSEGDLTKKMRFASNDNLDEILDGLDAGFRKDLAGFKSGYKTDNQNFSADDVEAFIGNYYLNHGLLEAKKYFEKIFANEIDRFDPESDYISRLQEYTQQTKQPLPLYEPVSDQTVQNNQHDFHIPVFIGPEKFGEGRGGRKSKARQQAALNALKTLGIIQK